MGVGKGGRGQGAIKAIAVGSSGPPGLSLTPSGEWGGSAPPPTLDIPVPSLT